MVQLSRKELEALAIGFGIADFFAEGKLSAPFGRAAKAALVKAGPAIARGIIRYGPAVVSTAARVTPQGAAISTAAVLAIQNREKIADLAAQGYEIAAPVVPAAQRYAAGVAERAMDPQSFVLPETSSPQTMQLERLGIIPSGKPRRKIASAFNKAVKKGMAIVKGSTTYGKKGTINNAKKAFSLVTKTVSSVKKKKKVAKSGIKRKIGLAIRSIL